jgi:two-component system, cell cycle sensor histidine kinase and response regulator CckA
MKDTYIAILSALAVDLDLDFKSLGIDACIAKGPIDMMTQRVLMALEQSQLRTAQRSAHGVLLGMEGVYKREVSSELLFTKKHLEGLLNNMSEGILELNQDTRIVYANSTATSIIGIAEERLLSKSFVDIFDPAQKQTIKALLETNIESARTMGEDQPLIVNSRMVLLNVLPVRDEDHKTLTIIVNDITDRKRLENQLWQAQRMESIATLAGGIAHQFNNALSVITGNVELMKMHLPEATNMEYLEPIIKSSYRMSLLTSQLLAYARGGKYNPKPMDWSSFVKDTLPLIRHSVAPSIVIETHLPNDVWHTRADLTQMQMALSAIVTNAAEAVTEKGRIRISASNEEIGESHSNLKPGRYSCLIIEDNGKGMDEETRNRIFEPFFTTNFQGRGLGMAAVYGIIQNHGGWISVASELGKGTSVQIYLPVSDAHVEESKHMEVKLETSSGVILIIEDEAMIMEVCKTMLESLGYRVLEAMNAEKAIDVVRTFEDHIDLALLDIALPDMDGEKLYPVLKDKRPDLKVVVCSGYSIDGPAQDILNAGADGFIQKPYSFAMLSLKLKEILGHNCKTGARQSGCGKM